MLHHNYLPEEITKTTLSNPKCIITKAVDIEPEIKLEKRIIVILIRSSNI